ncbi:hypothetical protein ES332_D11G215700v1 [Gossypium tomentosum]|uniref:Uncharacterized protein n=1 Tax=Gossypium tomentosum TaxID=34277 RepID=A0A5D2IQ81_GOSTO|nr:hypothetical protein ES332_D11G215700v1 [Gossypium tomentosum]
MSKRHKPYSFSSSLPPNQERRKEFWLWFSFIAVRKIVSLSKVENEEQRKDKNRR